MAKTTTVMLREPLIGHGGPVREVVLKAPNLVQYAAIGNPVTLAPSAEGRPVVIENDAAIAAYIEACVVEPKDKLLLGQVQLADAMDIREAVLDFFVEARRARSTPSSPTSSSETSA